MLHRPVPLAQIRRLPNRVGHVALCEWNGLAQRAAQRQMRRDRGGKRASRAVRVASRHARMTVLDELPVLEQQIDAVGGGVP